MRISSFSIEISENSANQNSKKVIIEQEAASIKDMLQEVFVIIEK